MKAKRYVFIITISNVNMFWDIFFFFFFFFHPLIPFSLSHTHSYSFILYVLSYMLCMLYVFSLQQMSKDGNATGSILSYTPNIEDQGKFLSCRAENTHIPDSGVENGLKLNLHRKSYSLMCWKINLIFFFNHTHLIFYIFFEMWYVEEASKPPILSIHGIRKRFIFKKYFHVFFFSFFSQTYAHENVK